jgi:hypothetical protein
MRKSKLKGLKTTKAGKVTLEAATNTTTSAIMALTCYRLNSIQEIFEQVINCTACILRRSSNAIIV